MSNVFTRGSSPSFKEMMRLETVSLRVGCAGWDTTDWLCCSWPPLPPCGGPCRRCWGPTPFLVFYLAWVGAAAFGGLGPGLLATAASWVCLEVLFDFTLGETIFSDAHELGRFLVLMAGGLTVSLVAERMRRGRIYERRTGP